MKKCFKKAICKCLGHQELEEVCGRRLNSNRYNVLREVRCLRCDKEIDSKIVAYSLSRAELLKYGWFIEK